MKNSLTNALKYTADKIGGAVEGAGNCLYMGAGTNIYNTLNKEVNPRKVAIGGLATLMTYLGVATADAEGFRVRAENGGVSGTCSFNISFPWEGKGTNYKNLKSRTNLHNYTANMNTGEKVLYAIESATIGENGAFCYVIPQNWKDNPKKTGAILAGEVIVGGVTYLVMDKRRKDKNEKEDKEEAARLATKADREVADDTSIPADEPVVPDSDEDGGDAVGDEEEGKDSGDL